MESNNFQNWIEKMQMKQKPLIIGLATLVAIIGATWYVSQVMLPEREAEAQEAIFMAQLNFENKNFDKALNGDAKFKGFNYVKDNYSYTKAKDIAQLYAGLCNLNMGKYDKAIEDLKNYSSDVSEIQATAYSALGDAYAEKNNMAEAVAYYEKGARATKNNVLSPRLALKAAKAYEVKKDLGKAMEMYKFVKAEFPNSQEAGTVDIYMTRLENQM
jgi:tetratricopeptide (TPR) repeat protein